VQQLFKQSIILVQVQVPAKNAIRGIHGK